MLQDARRQTEQIWALIQENEVALKQMISKRIRNRDTANECFSDIAFDAVRHAVTHFNPQFNVMFQRFLIITFRWYVLSWLRSQHKQATRFQTTIAEDTDEEQFDYSDVCAILNKDYLYTLIENAELTQWEYAIVYRRYYDDMTFQDIGNEFGYPESTIRKHHNIALQKIKSAASWVD